MAWYAHDIDAYDADTMHLSASEDGIYSRLLRFYYKTRVPLPDDDRALASIARVSLADWEAVKGTIRAFFKPRRGRLHHKRCDAELDREDMFAKKRSEHSKRAIEKRWGKSKGKILPVYDENTQRTTTVIPNDTTRPDQTRPDKKDDPNGSFVVAAGDDVVEMVRLYNETASRLGLPAVAKLTDARKAKAKVRLREHGLPGWQSALERLGSVPCRWMLGENDRGWKADFDFLLTPSKFTRLVEGGYDRDAHGPNGGRKHADISEPRTPKEPPPAAPEGWLEPGEIVH